MRFDKKNIFLLELESKNLTPSSICSNENYVYLSFKCADVVNKHNRLKQKVFQGNNFTDKHLRKEIYQGNALRNRFNKKPNKFNWEKYKKQ